MAEPSVLPEIREAARRLGGVDHAVVIRWTPRSAARSGAPRACVAGWTPSRWCRSCATVPLGAFEGWPLKEGRRAGCHAASPRLRAVKRGILTWSRLGESAVAAGAEGHGNKRRPPMRGRRFPFHDQELLPWTSRIVTGLWASACVVTSTEWRVGVRPDAASSVPPLNPCRARAVPVCPPDEPRRACRDRGPEA